MGTEILNFADRLTEQIQIKKTPLIVGLDPRAGRLPAAFQEQIGQGTLHDIAAAYVNYCVEIINVVAPLVPAVKPQMAFFEQLGSHGMLALEHVIDYAKESGLMVILDGKRNDIGSTAEAYATAYLGEDSSWGCDALTVNPWMGHDSLSPFINVGKSNGAGIFALVKTSNPGSADYQDKISDGKPMFEQIAADIQALALETKGSSGYGIAGSVVGATHPEQLAQLRSLMPNSIFLIPGFGAQGGSATDVAGGFASNGLGAVVNSSRGIIFAYENEKYSDCPDWLDAVEQATTDAITAIADHTPAGNIKS